MKKKLKLDDLKVNSFVTIDKIKGGTDKCTGCVSTCGILPPTGSPCGE